MIRLYSVLLAFIQHGCREQKGIFFLDQQMERKKSTKVVTVEWNGKWCLVSSEWHGPVQFRMAQTIQVSISTQNWTVTVNLILCVKHLQLFEGRLWMTKRNTGTFPSIYLWTYNQRESKSCTIQLNRFILSWKRSQYWTVPLRENEALMSMRVTGYDHEIKMKQKAQHENIINIRPVDQKVHSEKKPFQS